MKKQFLLLNVLFLLTLPLLATHNLAGDITYTKISTGGSLTYGITIRTFTNTLNTMADRCELTVYFDCNHTDSAVAPRTNGPSSLCPSTHDGVMLGSDYPNIKMNIYYIEHTFPGTGNYCISVADPNRSSGICNIPNSVSTPFALEATLVINPFYGVNNAPIYTAVPVIHDSIGVVSHYNPNVTEADGDSLYYQFVTPAGAVGYTYPAYSNSFSINATTGTTTWDTPDMICLYVFDIKIMEYRRIGGTAYLIGSTMQEVWNISNTYVASVGELSNTTPLNVFPNPASDEIKFSVGDSKGNEKYIVEITNSLGQTINHFEIINNSTVTLPLDNLNSGIYFYRMTSSNANPQQGKFTVINRTY